MLLSVLLFPPPLSVGNSYTLGNGPSGYIEYGVWGCRPTLKGVALCRYAEKSYLIGTTCQGDVSKLGEVILAHHEFGGW